MPKICFIGCMEVGLNVLKYLINHDLNIDYVVTISPEVAQKNNVSSYVDYEIDLNGKISLYKPTSYGMQQDEDFEFFQRQRFDLAIVVGWNRLIPGRILETFSIGAIGNHGSSDFLPRGRGRSPMNWSIIEGKRRFILQMFLMQAVVDDGNVIDYEQFDINDFDTIETLHYKAAIVLQRMLSRTLKNLTRGKLKSWPQRGSPTYYTKRDPEEGKIDWQNQDVDQIHNLIKALTKPYPGAFSFLRGKKFYFWRAALFDRTINYRNAAYGQIVELLNGRLIINCLGGLLILYEYSYDGEISKNDILE